MSPGLAAEIADSRPGTSATGTSPARARNERETTTYQTIHARTLTPTRAAPDRHAAARP